MKHLAFCNIIQYTLAIELNYPHASIADSRTHAFAAKAQGHISEDLKTLKRNLLKTTILENFKRSLEGISVAEAFNGIAR